MGFFGPSIFAAVSPNVPAPPPLACHVSFHLPTARPASRPRPAPTPSPLPLPLELVLSILELAAYPDGTPDRTLLRHCALVCKAWSLLAQKLLFTSVQLRSQPAADAFLAAATSSTPKGRILRDAVVRLRAVIDHNQPCGLSQHSLALAVSRCPNLYDLDLSLYGRASPGIPDTSRMRRPAPSFDDTTLALLRSAPRISSLHFTNWSENSHSLSQLLAVWSSLRSLAISGTTPPETPSPFHFPCVLTELRINFQIPLSLDFVNWLTHTSALRVLEFEREPPTQILQAFVDAHGSTLHSLALPGCTLPEHTTAVQSCTQLRELRIESPCVLGKLWRCLPSTIEHIALGVDMNTPLQPLVDLVRAKSGDGEGWGLRAVTVHTTNGGERHALLGVLKMVCAFKGVQLRVLSDVWTFREQLMTSSLSSVVSNLVRASMGTSVPGTVADEDLDRHVAELIMKEAKMKAERYGEHGIRALLRGAGGSDSPAPRTNKRFLSSIIKTTEDHNKTVLRTQALAAQEQKRERDEQERRARRKRAQEAAEAERMRRGKRREESWDRWDGRDREEERERKRKRDWERDWEEDGEEERERERERERRKKRHREREKRRSGRKNREREASRSRSRSPRPTKRRSRRERDEEEDDTRLKSRKRSRSRSRRKEAQKYALDDIDSDTAPHHHHSPRRSTSPILEDMEYGNEEQDDEPQRQSTTVRSEETPYSHTKSKRRRTPSPTPPLPSPSHSRSRTRSPSPAPKSKSKHKHKSKRAKTSTTSSHTAHTASPRPPSPSGSPPPLPSGTPPPLPPSPASHLPSKMDKYFEESYDPRLDVAPLSVPSVPKTGLINDAEYAGWDAMLELLRVRREDKEEKRRLERLGVSMTSDKGLPPAKRRDPGSLTEEVNVMGIQYKKKGSVREWDLGKEGLL
ncbi:hypothetical protein C0995_006803 [Termitomyces sp. Mi166|nr:hypothetical protein C0995_006803 [Termitomyces sp. Mi166\